MRFLSFDLLLSQGNNNRKSWYTHFGYKSKDKPVDGAMLEDSVSIQCDPAAAAALPSRQDQVYDIIILRL